MRWSGQAAEHESDHGKTHESCDGAGIAFEVAGQAAIVADPCQGSLDDPAFRQDDELVQFVAFDDLDDPAAGAGGGLRDARPLITGIGEDALDEGKEPAGSPVEDQSRAVAILDVGGMNDDVQEKAEGVDENMPFAARDLLARIIALRVKPGAPFCAALALWLSMIAAVGLASLPSRARVAR